MGAWERLVGEATAMDSAEVRRRATAGAVVLATRGTALRIVAFAGNVVLARLLVPSDFGLLATMMLRLPRRSIRRGIDLEGERC